MLGLQRLQGLRKERVGELSSQVDRLALDGDGINWGGTRAGQLRCCSLGALVQIVLQPVEPMVDWILIQDVNVDHVPEKVVLPQE